MAELGADKSICSDNDDANGNNNMNLEIITGYHHFNCHPQP